ncbi:glutathione S-transferase N-terminal domain-containing protein [Albimonas sp. CAU 1670]|uniref:glutathione S-transferase family protein n=1 Tax=Albimonas sp. CAU 1670 TaxID=3032599 RepID=UPI0023DAFDA6|nr:glutathione S-transferase N-terminal domain-containing protein [Albimonas sp. CAU 1670]MDF2232812.1 glutathione S-transferase N-terminal domain-containing protein [Albimonas sp. CAU 1670]
MIVIHSAPGACSLASHIALREAGAEFELRRVDFAADQQRSPEYLALNPKGRVPLLQTERGALTETPAILTWIAQSFPQANLAPADPWDFAQMQSVLAYICATLHVNHAHGRRSARWADQESSHADMRAKVPQTVGESFRHLEEEVFKGPFVMGDGHTVADAYLYTVSRWMETDKIDPARFPKVHEHRTRMQARPAVQAALEAEGLKPL